MHASVSAIFMSAARVRVDGQVLRQPGERLADERDVRGQGGQPEADLGPRAVGARGFGCATWMLDADPVAHVIPPYERWRSSPNVSEPRAVCAI